VRADVDTQTFADEILTRTIGGLVPGSSLFAALDKIPAAIYVTDKDGYVLHFNPWCHGLAGREPQAGKDRWCVTWKLFTNQGEFLPHDSCPMADAISGGKRIRGVTAVAERPDGSRVSFMPFPTPIFSLDDELMGAVNMLVDVSEQHQPEDLRNQAMRCERLATGVGDPTAQEALDLMAIQYRIKASALDLVKPTPAVE
jgi:PAS domain-containing protein